MSELIDRIFDAEKISAEVGVILQNLQKVTVEINNVKEAVKANEAEIRKAKGTEQLSDSTKKLNDNVANGGKAMKTWQDEAAKLQEKTKQLTDTEKQASIEIAKARLELQAAQKATKEAAIAEIEATAATGKLTGSYNELDKSLKAAQIAYKNLSAEERNSAKGQELLKKIQETQKSLKSTDAAMGNFQRNVGNYASALDGLIPNIGGVGGQLLQMSASAKNAGIGFGEMSKGVVKSFGQMAKAFLTNPIGIAIMAILLVISQVKKAFEESEERSNKLSEAFARFKPIARTIGDVFEFIADGIIKFVEWTGKAIGVFTEFLGINPKGSADKFVEAEKLKQKAIKDGRDLQEKSSKLEAEIAEKRAIINDKESYTFEQRMTALKKARKLEIELSNAKLTAARNELKATLAQNALDDNNAEANQRKADAVSEFNKTKQENAELNRKLSKEEQKLIKEHEADMKAEAEAAKAAADKIIAARRRLVDSQLALMEEGVNKEIAISTENYNRQIQDLKRNGEYTKELGKNLQKIHEKEIQKIKDDAAKKKLDDQIKADELVIANMERAGNDTLMLQKQLLAKKMEAEIKAGGDESEIRKKYQYLLLDLESNTAEKRVQNFEKELKKQSEILSKDYSEREKKLKERYINGELKEEEYQAALTKLKADALKEANDLTIAALQKELEVAGLSEDKRAELSNKIKDLQIQNENAVLDATIKANEDKVKSDKEAIAKRIEIANALGQATMEIFGEIAEFAKQQSENRIAELEQQQEKNDETFEKAQNNLDNALMSDENRAAKQKELDEKKAASDKAIADKIQAEKIRQAKWDKANGIVQAIISSGLAILNASQTKPFPLGLIAAGLAAATGAIQVATIASQQIPAYETGGTTKGEQFSLWGEKRPEVAVTPTGDVLLAEKPTISHFDAGTKIYKSVSDYENFIAKQAVNQVVFDYDKLAASIPSNEFEFDGNGLLIARDKRGNRRTLINRRYKL